MSGFDPGALSGKLKLITPGMGTSLLVQEAIIAPPDLALTIDGASTLSIELDDTDRTLLGSDTLTTRSFRSEEHTSELQSH